MTNLIQAELDIVEEHVLTCLFQDANNPQINGVIKSYCAITGKNPIHLINDSITRFEQIIKPLMQDNGMLSGDKLSQLIAIKFNKQIPLSDFRLIDITRALEPWLLTLGTFLQ